MNDNNYYLKKSKAVLREVKKSVIGKDDVICKVYMAIIAGGHVLLDDIPGVGKTTMAQAFANALGLEYNRIQFTPDVMPSDITGFSMYNRQTGQFEFKHGATMCNVLLADEINRTSPKTQSALLQIMEEYKVTVDGATYDLPDPFMVIATQNPVGSIGTQKLPESQMDRFMIRLSMGYPSIEDEVVIMKTQSENYKRADMSQCVLENGDIQGIRNAVADIYVDDSIYNYVAMIASKTRSRDGIVQGVSPRGSIAAIAMAKAEEFDWKKLLDGVDLFYFSGITPAISTEIEKALENALALCREKKIRVVCDLNYRGKMWSTKDAQRVMRRLMAYVDVCIANDEDFESSLGIPAYDGDMSRGIEQIESYKEGMLEIQKQFPNCKAVASVLRNLYTVEDGDWMGIYLKDGKFYESPVHKVHSFEAVGAGDAFGAGLIHAMLHDFEPQKAIDFAISASVLKLMIQHDANVASETEIEQIMKQGGTNLQR